jgi:hypothetical protein
LKQFLLGAGSALLLAAGGVVWWTSDHAKADSPIPPRPAGAQVMPSDDTALSEPPAASAKTREEKRFSRYDKDKNGAISREEYLAARRKAFAKLDTNGDGRLQFEEYAIKTSAKFSKADGDRSGILNPAEFLNTRVVRKARSAPNCPPPIVASADDD